MVRAREAIRSRGGASRANVFTRLMLALFGFIPWRAVPVMPVEIMLLPTLVSVPPRQDFLLEPHRHRAAAGAAGAQAEGAQSQGGHASTSSSSSRRRRSGRPRRRRSRKRRGSGSFAASIPCCAPLEPLFPEAAAATRDRARGGLGQRAAQRRGRSRRDLPGDGEQRDDVRRARLSGRSSAARDRAQVDREAAGGARARGLLPALRLADLGHRARLPRLLEVGGEHAPTQRLARARLAGAAADPRCQRRLDRAAARSPPRRLGVPIRQSALSRRRRHGGRGDGDGSRAGLERQRPTSAARSPARGNGSWACKARTAAGARSMPTTNTTISTTSRSPITAPCSIRRPRT